MTQDHHHARTAILVILVTLAFGAGLALAEAHFGPIYQVAPR